MDQAIVVRRLSKRFSRRHADQPTTLKEMVLRGLRRSEPAEPFWALREVSFSVRRGCMLGIIGRNGAGKSTLLRLIGGVGRPDQGTVEVRGRVGALLDLGAGFHPDLTGRENAFIAGIIAGLTRAEVAACLPAIVAFAELEDFIDAPLRTYSSGMQMRLAFAVAAHTTPEILLIDEVLAVGDLAFQRRCIDRIAQFRARGCTILLVSHDLGQIQQLCDEAICLEGGRLVGQGPPEVVVGQYRAAFHAETQRRTPPGRPAVVTPSGAVLRLNENRFGSLELEICNVRLCDASGHQRVEVEGGAPLRVEIDYAAPRPLPAPIFGVHITRDDGTVCCDLTTAATGLALPPVVGRGRIVLTIDRLDLAGGTYFVDVGAYQHDWAYSYDYHWHVYRLAVRAPSAGNGSLFPPHRWGLAPPDRFEQEVMQQSRRG